MEAELSPYFLNNHKESLFWVAIVFLISLICFFILRLISQPKKSKFLSLIYKIILYAGNTFCWGMMYYFIIDQFLEGFLYSFISIIYFTINCRNGILSFLAGIVYISFFLLFYFHTYVMISVCTSCELKFEREVEKKV